MSDASLGTATLRTKLDTSGLKVGLSQAETDATRTFKRLDDQIVGLGRSFQRVGAGLTVGLTAPLSALAATGLRSAMQLETFSKSLNVLIGDTDRAKAAFEELYEFSANTTFEWRSLTEGTRTLAAFGVEAEDLVPTLSMLGDVAAGLDTPLEDLAQIFGRVRVTGRLGMEEVNRLADRGVPIYTELARVMGVTEQGVRELVSTGSVGFPQLEAVFRNLTTEGGRFFGMMEAQTDTTAGRLARLKDSFEQVTDVIGERLLPGFDRLIETGQKATDWFVELDDTTQGLFVGLGTTLAVSGPLMLGLGTMATQLPRIAAGFRAIRLAMGPMFGPVGLLVTGVGVIAGFSAALSGRGDSLDASVRKANDALASGDTDSLTGALDEVIAKADGPLKDVFQQFRDDLRETGEVGVQQAQRIANAFSNLPELMRAQAEVTKAQAALEALRVSMTSEAMTGFGSSDPANVEAFLRDQLAKLGRADVLEYLRYDADSNRLRFDPLPDGGHITLSGVATEVVATANRMLEAPVNGLAAAEAQLAQANQTLADVLARINQQPAARPPGAPGSTPGGSITMPAQVGTEIAEALRNPRPFSPATIRAMGAAEVEGPGAGMATFATAEELQKALMEARSRLGPVATEWADYLAQELEREILRFQGGLPNGQRRRFLSLDPSANVGGAVALRPPSVSANVLPAHMDPNSLFTQWASYLEAETERQRERAHAIDRVTTNTDRQITAERQLAMARQQAQEQSRQESQQLLADFRRDEAQRAAAFRMSGDNARTYTQQVQLQASALGLAAREGITLTEAFQQLTVKTRSIADVESDLMNAREQLRTAGDDAGRLAAHVLMEGFEDELQKLQHPFTPVGLSIQPFARIDGMDQGDWARMQKAQQDAADRFSETVVRAGFSFGDAAIHAFKDGDVVGVIRAGLSGAGSILGGANLGTLGFLGGTIGSSSLLMGGFGLLQGLLGLFGGGNRSTLETTRAAGVTPRGAPAIDLSIIINQSLSVQSLTDPASRRAVDRLLDDMVRRVEDTLKRNVLPRLNALDGGTA